MTGGGLRGAATGLGLVLALGALARSGLEPLRVWWLSMLVLGAAPLALAVGGPWLRPVLAGSALFVGASAQLALTDPLWFQRIEIAVDWRWHQLLVAAIGVQLGVTLWVWARRAPGIAVSDVVRAFGGARVVGLVAGILALSAPLMDKLDRPSLFFQQVALASAFFLLNAANVLALARSLPASGWRELEAWTRSRGLPTVRRALVPCLALWVGGASAALCLFAFERVPHVPDEVAYVFQAKLLGLGEIRLAAPPPAVLAAVDYDFVHAFEGRWFSIFPPGWPAFLAVGVALGAGWLVNPLLAAACVPLAHRVFLGLTDRRTADVGITLMAVSPWWLGTSASLMAHTTTLFLMLAAWVLLLAAIERRRWALALAAGGLMGLVFDTRPLDGVVVGTLTGLWCLMAPRPRPLGAVVGYGLGCILTGALLFPWHAALTGNPLKTPIHNYFDQVHYEGSNRFGFAEDIGPRELWGGIDLYHGHGPLEALVHTHQNLHTLNVELLGFGVGSLALVGIHLLWGRKTRVDLAMALLALSIITVYGFYWFSGGFYVGPRYWFMVFLPLVFLSARGALTLVERLRSVPGLVAPELRVGLPLVVLCAFAMVSFTSWRGVAKYHDFRGFHDDYRQLLAVHDLSGALIFVRDTSVGDYGSAHVFNSPRLAETGPLFVRDLGEENNRRVAAAFPGRSIYFAVGRSPEAAAHLVAGPMTSAELP